MMYISIYYKYIRCPPLVNIYNKTFSAERHYVGKIKKRPPSHSLQEVVASLCIIQLYSAILNVEQLMLP